MCAVCVCVLCVCVCVCVCVCSLLEKDENVLHMFCIVSRRDGQKVSHLLFSWFLSLTLIVRDKTTRQCPQTTTFEDRGELKQNQTKVPLPTSLLPYCWARPVYHDLSVFSCTSIYDRGCRD